MDADRTDPTVAVALDADDQVAHQDPAASGLGAVGH
jgi:hypothetical protein